MNNGSAVRTTREMHVSDVQQTGRKTSNLDVRFENVTRALWAVATAITLSMGPAAACAAGLRKSADAQAALQSLYAKVPAAKTIGAKAQAVLVFPKITKAGLGIGGQFGEGALIKGGRRSGTTTLLVCRPAYRPERSSMAMQCSS